MRRSLGRGGSREARFVGLLSILILSFCAACNKAPAETAYTPPQTMGADGDWQSYVDPPLIEAALAKTLNPSLATPEGAVVKFLSSRLRGDAGWKQAMAEPISSKAQRSLDEWDDWDLQRFQLKARRLDNQASALVRVYFEIRYGDDQDSGEDEFDLVNDNGDWRVRSPPA